MDSQTAASAIDADLDIIRAALSRTPYKLHGSTATEPATKAEATALALAALERVAIQFRLEAPSIALGRHVRGLIRQRTPDTLGGKPVFGCSFTMFQEASSADEAIAIQVGGKR